MIRVHNLSFSYPGGLPPVLKAVNLEINEGEYIAIIGPNGCGKTTLVRHFNALLLPSEGEVEIDGLSTRHPKNFLEIRRRVGMIFQNPDNQIIGMTVEEDVAFGPGNLLLPAGEIRKRVDKALAAVGLTGLATRHPHTLSGGEKQLLALAGLLAMDPRFIVLDEPTASLDPAGKKMVLSLLSKLQQQGIAIIQVTHNMEEAALAGRLLVMDQGKVVADGNPRDILSQVEWLQALGLAPPQVTRLMWRLQQSGEDIATNLLTVEEAAEEIEGLLVRLRGLKRAYVPQGRK